MPAPNGSSDVIARKTQRLVGFDYANPEVIFFITACADHGSPFADERIAQRVVASLDWLRVHRQLRIYVYCLMSDHLHLLCQLGTSDIRIGRLIGYLKSFTTNEAQNLGYQGTLWQSDFHDRVLRRLEDAFPIGRYILENPARAGIVERAEEYPWSGMPDPM